MHLSTRYIRLMGTVIQLSIDGPSADEVLNQAIDLLYQFNQRFSANDDHSELMAINKQAGIAPVKVHPELFELIRIGKMHSLPYDSFLNIAIGPLVQLWRIGFSDAQRPSDTAIQDCLTRINPENIVLNETEQTVFLQQHGMKIDLGALAKGYIADRLADFFRAQHVTTALINLGGNVLTFGDCPNHADGFWRVGIQTPHQARGQHHAVLRVKNQAVVTSGIYERTLQIDGKTYHHIFSSQTGYPMASDVASLTIVSNHALDGEIWTTRLFGKRIPQIIAELSINPTVDGLVIDTNGQLYHTPHIAKHLE